MPTTGEGLRLVGCRSTGLSKEDASLDRLRSPSVAVREPGLPDAWCVYTGTQGLGGGCGAPSRCNRSVREAAWRSERGWSGDLQVAGGSHLSCRCRDKAPRVSEDACRKSYKGLWLVPWSIFLSKRVCGTRSGCGLDRVSPPLPQSGMVPASSTAEHWATIARASLSSPRPLRTPSRRTPCRLDNPRSPPSTSWSSALGAFLASPPPGTPGEVIEALTLMAGDPADPLPPRLFFEAVEQAPSAISITDARATILYANRAFESPDRLQPRRGDRPERVHPVQQRHAPKRSTSSCGAPSSASRPGPAPWSTAPSRAGTIWPS